MNPTREQIEAALSWFAETMPARMAAREPALFKLHLDVLLTAIPALHEILDQDKAAHAATRDSWREQMATLTAELEALRCQPTVNQSAPIKPTAIVAQDHDALSLLADWRSKGCPGCDRELVLAAIADEVRAVRAGLRSALNSLEAERSRCSSQINELVELTTSHGIMKLALDAERAAHAETRRGYELDTASYHAEQMRLLKENTAWQSATGYPSPEAYRDGRIEPSGDVCMKLARVFWEGRRIASDWTWVSWEEATESHEGAARGIRAVIRELAEMGAEAMPSAKDLREDMGRAGFDGVVVPGRDEQAYWEPPVEVALSIVRDRLAPILGARRALAIEPTDAEVERRYALFERGKANEDVSRPQQPKESHVEWLLRTNKAGIRAALREIATPPVAVPSARAIVEAWIEKVGLDEELVQHFLPKAQRVSALFAPAPPTDEHSVAHETFLVLRGMAKMHWLDPNDHPADLARSLEALIGQRSTAKPPTDELLAEEAARAPRRETPLDWHDTFRDGYMSGARREGRR